MILQIRLKILYDYEWQGTWKCSTYQQLCFDLFHGLVLGNSLLPQSLKQHLLSEVVVLQQLPFVLFNPLSQKTKTYRGQVRRDSGMKMDHRGVRCTSFETL